MGARGSVPVNVQTVLLVGTPAVTTNTVPTRLVVPASTARAALGRSRNDGVLTEVTGNKRGRVWAARSVSDVLTPGL